MALCHIEPTGIDITEFSFGRLRNTDQPCAGGRVKYKITVINNGDQDIELTECIGNTYLEDEALTGKTKETVMVKAHSSWVDEREMQVLNWPSAWYYVKVKLTYSLQSTAILSYDAFWLDQCVPSAGGGIMVPINGFAYENTEGSNKAEGNCGAGQEIGFALWILDSSSIFNSKRSCLHLHGQGTSSTCYNYKCCFIVSFLGTMKFLFSGLLIK